MFPELTVKLRSEIPVQRNRGSRHRSANTSTHRDSPRANTTLTELTPESEAMVASRWYSESLLHRIKAVLGSVGRAAVPRLPTPHMYLLILLTASDREGTGNGHLLFEGTFDPKLT